MCTISTNHLNLDPLLDGCPAQRTLCQVSVTDAAATEVATGEEDDVTLRTRKDRIMQNMLRIFTFLSIQTTHSADWKVSIGGAEGAPSSLGSAGAVGVSSSISVGGALGSVESPFSIPLNLAFILSPIA